MEPVSYSLWHRIVSKITGEPIEYVACPSKHAFKTARMKWTEEVVEYYEKCDGCGKEFYADE